MASITENLSFYKGYDWSSGGEEWADAWGGSDMQWFGSILPRIHLFLPAKNILEIGSGYGRWVEYFLPYCEHLCLLDLTQECVDYCKKKYNKNKKVSCHRSSGLSLETIENNSIDFVFSFHSLVHADDFTMRKYVKDISSKLTSDGVAFIHHSNAGEYVNDATIDQEELEDYRDVSMTAEKMRGFADSSGLICSSQELVNWETNELLDCFSVLARPNALWGRRSIARRNTKFVGEMAHWGKLSELYGSGQTMASPPCIYSFEI